jgi:hypothetical protein
MLLRLDSQRGRGLFLRVSYRIAICVKYLLTLARVYLLLHSHRLISLMLMLLSACSVLSTYTWPILWDWAHLSKLLRLISILVLETSIQRILLIEISLRRLFTDHRLRQDFLTPCRCHTTDICWELLLDMPL